MYQYHLYGRDTFHSTIPQCDGDKRYPSLHDIIGGHTLDKSTISTELITKEDDQVNNIIKDSTSCVVQILHILYKTTKIKPLWSLRSLVWILEKFEPLNSESWQ